MNWRGSRSRRQRRPGLRRLLVLDTSYTWDDAGKRDAAEVFLYRDLAGYFHEVWSVHPFAGNSYSRLGRPRVRRVHARHVVVEGGSSLPQGRSVTQVARFSLGQVRLISFLLRAGRGHGFTAVRSGDPLYLGLLGLGLARWWGCPLVVRVPGNFDEIRSITERPTMPKLFPTIGHERRLERLVLEKADWVLAPNDNNRQFALRRGAANESTSVVRYGSLLSKDIWEAVDSNSEAVGSGLEWRDTPPFVLVVSRLEPVKQVEHAIRAFAIAGTTHPGIELWIAGEGSERLRLETLASELRIHDRVRFWGSVDQRWLALAYRACQVFLSPQSGRALSEAALMGTTIVGYDRDWQSEIVSCGDEGILVQAGDWAALGGALNWVLSNPNAALIMGQAVRARALELLDPRQALRDETDIYESLTRRGTGRIRTATQDTDLLGH